MSCRHEKNRLSVITDSQTQHFRFDRYLSSFVLIKIRIWMFLKCCHVMMLSKLLSFTTGQNRWVPFLWHVSKEMHIKSVCWSQKVEWLGVNYNFFFLRTTPPFKLRIRVHSHVYSQAEMRTFVNAGEIRNEVVYPKFIPFSTVSCKLIDSLYCCALLFCLIFPVNLNRRWGNCRSIWNNH
jgi:hypothetical protein